MIPFERHGIGKRNASTNHTSDLERLIYKSPEEFESHMTSFHLYSEPGILIQGYLEHFLGTRLPKVCH